jgi:N-acetylglucosaminyldiphosphoundecaprenol N-acetyl-beta-D-mannosaminyltransferase
MSPLTDPMTATTTTDSAVPPVVVVSGGEASQEAASQEAEQSNANPPLEPLPRTVIWDVPFDQVDMAQAVDRIEALVARRQPSYVVTANLNYVMLHHRHPDISRVTREADLILADGQPIVWRSKLCDQPLPTRVAGSEMIFDLARRASQKRWGIYFLGGQDGVAEACAKRLQREYPGMRIAGIESPPFRELSAHEQAEQDQRIQRSNADLLLVAFGQPKGERWIHQHYQRLGVPVSIQLGASFDFVAGTSKRAPVAFQKLGAEWLYRMGSDPKRLVPRYWSNAVFLAKALSEDWKRTVKAWGMGLEEDAPRAC